MNDYEKQHVEALREYLPECTVLLRNEKDFRVSQPGKVALFGNGVRHTRKGGTGSGEVNSHYWNTVEKAFQERGFENTTCAWLDAYDAVLDASKKAFVRNTKKEAKAHHKFYLFYSMGMTRPEPVFDIPLKGEGELALYVLTRVSGEGNDRHFTSGDVLLTQSEIDAIHELDRRFDKFLLVLNVGGPVDLSPVMDVSNILVLSQLGVDTADALVDIVLGKANPSGRLATTWAKADDYQSIGDFGAWDDTYYREGIYVGYRYFASAKVKPLFPFGYGLSFTTFSQSVENVRIDGSIVNVSVHVRNTGKEAGKETIQLYVSVPSGNLDQPANVLATFAKTSCLKAGTGDVLHLHFDLKELASFSEAQSSYILEKGDYILQLGKNSMDVENMAVLRLEQSVLVKKVKAFSPKMDITDAVFAKEPSNTEGLPVFAVDAKAFEPTLVSYEQAEDDCPEINNLTDDELIHLNVGQFSDGGLASVIGEASDSVCGAAGETSSIAKAKGIPTLVMADGPAGLRLAKDYFRDEKGHHSIGKVLFEGFDELAGPVIRFALKLITPKPKKDSQILHQYCTAIPIGTAIAQSFNVDFAKLCGDIIGSEMEIFGVHLWLAPAINIHRSILCGRNFEYYSEDPLLTGKIAASITNAVQSHKGCGVTIKHYAANSQETNRYANNSVVSERALRDIYLKAFEIVVRESHPMAVMTSYNLLNGVHTSENRALVEDVLRCDFGFDGFVMTDWVVSVMAPGKESKYGAPVACNVANAGNDVFMPGSQAEIDDLAAGLKDGRISRTQLAHNARRVIRVIRRLRG